MTNTLHALQKHNSKSTFYHPQYPANKKYYFTIHALKSITNSSTVVQNKALNQLFFLEVLQIDLNFTSHPHNKKSKTINPIPQNNLTSNTNLIPHNSFIKLFQFISKKEKERRS